MQFGKLIVPSTLPASPGKGLARAPRGVMVPLNWAKLPLNLFLGYPVPAQLS